MYKRLTLEEFKKHSNIYYNRKTRMKEPLEKHINTQIKMINTVFEKPRREFTDLYYSTIIALNGVKFKGIHDYMLKNIEQINTALRDILKYSAVFHDIGKSFGVWDDNTVDNSQIIPGIHHYFSYSIMKLISRTIIVPESIIQLSEKLPTDPEEVKANFIRTIMFITLMHHEYFIIADVKHEFYHLERKKILFNGKLLKNCINEDKCVEYCVKESKLKWLYNSIFRIDDLTPYNIHDYSVDRIFIASVKKLMNEGKDKALNQSIKLFMNIKDYNDGLTPEVSTNILKGLNILKMLEDDFLESLKMNTVMTKHVHYSKLLYTFAMFDNHSASLNREGKPADNSLLKTLIKFEEYSVIDEVIRNSLGDGND